MHAETHHEFDVRPPTSPGCRRSLSLSCATCGLGTGGQPLVRLQARARRRLARDRARARPRPARAERRRQDDAAADPRGLLVPDDGTVAVLGGASRRRRARFRRLVGLVPSGDRSFYLRISGLENLVFFGAAARAAPARGGGARAPSCSSESGSPTPHGTRVGFYSHGHAEAAGGRARAPRRAADAARRRGDARPRPRRRATRPRRSSPRAPRRGAAVVWATQRLDEIRGFADRVTLLAQGRARFAGTVAELMAHTRPAPLPAAAAERRRDGATLERVGRAALGALGGARARGAPPVGALPARRSRDGVVLGDALAALAAAGVERARVPRGALRDRGGVPRSIARRPHDEHRASSTRRRARGRSRASSRKLPAFVRRDFLVAWSYRMSFVSDMRRPRRRRSSSSTSSAGSSTRAAAHVQRPPGELPRVRRGRHRGRRLHPVRPRPGLGGDARRAADGDARVGAHDADRARHRAARLGRVRPDLHAATDRRLPRRVQRSRSASTSPPPGCCRPCSCSSRSCRFVWGLGVLTAAMLLTFRRGSAVRRDRRRDPRAPVRASTSRSRCSRTGSRRSRAEIPVALAIGGMRDTLLGSSTFARRGADDSRAPAALRRLACSGLGAFRLAVRRERGRGTLGLY